MEPVTNPLAATEVGVMAPRPTVIDPLEVTGLPETLTPLDPVMPTEVTVPPPEAASIPGKSELRGGSSWSADRVGSAIPR